MLSEALQRNAKHEARLSNISGCWADRRVQRNHLGLKALASRTSSAALQLRSAENDKQARRR